MNAAEFTDLAGDAAEVANELLVDAAECVAALLKILPEAQAETIQKRPMQVAVHALLQLLDRRAEETNQHQTALVEVLRDLQDSIDFLAGVVSVDDDPNAEGMRHVQAAKDYDQLKWLVERASPSMSASEFREMHAFIQRLSGL